jgi:hypothetical protein
MNMEVNATLRPLYLRKRDPVSTVQKAGWAPGRLCTGAENLASTGIRSPASRFRSESSILSAYTSECIRFETQKWYENNISDMGGRGGGETNIIIASGHSVCNNRIKVNTMQCRKYTKCKQNQLRYKYHLAFVSLDADY